MIIPKRDHFGAAYHKSVYLVGTSHEHASFSSLNDSDAEQLLWVAKMSICFFFCKIKDTHIISPIQFRYFEYVGYLLCSITLTVLN